jgi:hypothetical protein
VFTKNIKVLQRFCAMYYCNILKEPWFFYSSRFRIENIYYTFIKSILFIFL